jgi:UDP-N-acetyl-D-mannosaminuronic acid transferase (WecB/TagA/CpsF family)
MNKKQPLLRVISSSKLNLLLSQRSSRPIIFSALNLFMLGHLRKNINITGYLYYWVDGIFAKYFLLLFKQKYIKQISGREFLEAVLFSCRGESVTIFGNCDSTEEAILANYQVKIHRHYLMPNVNSGGLSLPDELTEGIVLITLPSPIQENLALKLYEKGSKNLYRIYCVGGALSMLARPELDCPYFLRFVGLEFLYRMRTDTRRRLIRLLNSSYNFAFFLRRLSKLPISIITSWNK